MNTPSQQAELYRKAAETIEMCAKHGIEPWITVCGINFKLDEVKFVHGIENYEFPIALIEGQLVWADTVVYNSHWINGVPAHACSFTPNNDACWTLKPPKRTVMVELPFDDVVEWAKIKMLEGAQPIYNRLGAESRKALDNLKGYKS